MVRDASSWPLMLKSEYDWQYRTIPQRQADNREFDWPRGRIIGGCSAMNGMVFFGAPPLTTTNGSAWDAEAGATRTSSRSSGVLKPGIWAVAGIGGHPVRFTPERSRRRIRSAAP